MPYPASPENHRLRWVFIGLCCAMAMGAGTGCRVVKFAGKTTLATVSTTTEVAATAVRCTGKITCTAAEVSAGVATSGIKAAARLSKQGAVVFFNPQAGLVAELRWRKNLTLLAAARLAGMDGALRAVKVIRAGHVLDASRYGSKLVLSAGDVIEVAAHPGA